MPNLHELNGTESATYLGEEFNQEEKDAIAEEQAESLRQSIESRGRTIPEFANPPGVIWQGN